MKFQAQRNKLFKMFVLLGIAFFFLINFGHWLNYRPLKSRIDDFAEREIIKQEVAFLTYIQHNARQEEVLMLKLTGADEGVPMILDNEEDLERLINTVDGHSCTMSKSADSYELIFHCKQKLTVQMKDLQKTAWLGGIKYAIIGSLVVMLVGFITSMKMSDEKFSDNFV